MNILSTVIFQCLGLIVGVFGLLGSTKATEMPSNNQVRPKIAFIGHSPSSEKWWDPVKNSLTHGSTDFDVDVEFLNPENGDINEMSKIISGITKDKYSAVISTIADYQKLREPLILLTKQKGIPLVTSNTGTFEQSQSVGALFHIGQPEFEAGKRAAEFLKKTTNSLNFVCVIRYIENSASKERCDGFGKGLGSDSKGSILEVKGSDAEMEKSIVKYLILNPSVGILLTMGPTEAHPTILALKSTELDKRKIFFATFDLSKKIIDGIATGTIDFAIDQQPYLQGYIPVAILSYYLRDRERKLNIATISAFANPKLHERASRYGLSLKPGLSVHINSGPGFVTKVNLEKVEKYSGSYR